MPEHLLAVEDPLKRVQEIGELHLGKPYLLKLELIAELSTELGRG